MGTLAVPGACLYYEVHGTGPLLVLNGVPMGTAGFAALVPLLARHWTVLTYDPRGMFRSTVDDPGRDATPGLLADDLHRLLSMMDAGPVHLFGNSGGAVSGLALIARHPGLVRTFVAHEPPLAGLLPDAERMRAAIEEVCDDYVRHGRAAALAKYAAVTGIARFSQPPGGRRTATAPPVAVTPPAEVRAVLDRFFRRLLRPTAGYLPDLDALRAARTRIVVARGTTSDGQFANRAAVALAERLGIPVTDLPGDHTGFQECPEEFAARLHDLLGPPVLGRPDRRES